MNFVGVDLHKKTAVVCAVNQARQVLETRRLACSDPDGIRKWFATLESFQVVVEATASYEWFVRLVEPLADRVVLAHPGKLRVIAETTRKSDKLDAKVLAEFLALDMIPEAYRPTPRQREHRQWVRHRQYLRVRVASIRNRLRRAFSNYNADRPALFTAAGRKASAAIELSVPGRGSGHSRDRRGIGRGLPRPGKPQPRRRDDAHVGTTDRCGRRNIAYGGCVRSPVRPNSRGQRRCCAPDRQYCERVRRPSEREERKTQNGDRRGHPRQSCSTAVSDRTVTREMAGRPRPP